VGLVPEGYTHLRHLNIKVVKNGRVSIGFTHFRDTVADNREIFLSYAIRDWPGCSTSAAVTDMFRFKWELMNEKENVLTLDCVLFAWTWFYGILHH